MTFHCGETQVMLTYNLQYLTNYLYLHFQSNQGLLEVVYFSQTANIGVQTAKKNCNLSQAILKLPVSVYSTSLAL